MSEHQEDEQWMNSPMGVPADRAQPLSEEELASLDGRMVAEVGGRRELGVLIDRLRATLRVELERAEGLLARANELLRREEERSWKAEADLRTARESLKRFGKHGFHCTAGFDSWRDGDGTVCNCGLAAAIAPPITQEEPR